MTFEDKKLVTIEEVENWLKSRVAEFIVASGRGQIEIDFNHMFYHLKKDLEKKT